MPRQHPAITLFLDWLVTSTGSTLGSECIDWPFTRKDGRGVVYRGAGEKPVRVARYVLTHRVSAPPPGNQALHSCDNPACVNPLHLRWGTHQDNVQDRQERQRQARGVGHGRTTLIPDEVRDIRTRLAAGESQRQLARAYGVSKGTIANIVARRTWGHVT